MPQSTYPINAQALAALAEWGRRFSEAMSHDLQRIVKAFEPFMDACRKAYRDAGAPYGDTDEGMLRWMSDQRQIADLRWQADKIESIHETERQRRYLRDPEYHARVHVAAEFLEDWDFREGAGEDRSFYVGRAMELVDRLDALKALR